MISVASLETGQIRKLDGARGIVKMKAECSGEIRMKEGCSGERGFYKTRIGVTGRL